ncbi:MAG: hypothetical protein WBA62_17200 [Xanthobacteraceae bacterium]
MIGLLLSFIGAVLVVGLLIAAAPYLVVLFIALIAILWVLQFAETTMGAAVLTSVALALLIGWIALRVRVNRSRREEAERQRLAQIVFDKEEEARKEREKEALEKATLEHYERLRNPRF